jgi:hypothetical protein
MIAMVIGKILLAAVLVAIVLAAIAGDWYVLLRHQDPALEPRVRWFKVGVQMAITLAMTTVVLMVKAVWR